MMFKEKSSVFNKIIVKNVHKAIVIAKEFKELVFLLKR